MTGIWKMDSEPVFLDTSGVLAYLDASDQEHPLAAQSIRQVVEWGSPLVMTDYVRLESWALIQRRMGLAMLETFRNAVLPRCEVEVVGQEGFARVSGQCLVAQRRTLSLVDVASFDCMRRRGLKRALAFDAHFEEQGFLTPNSPGW